MSASIFVPHRRAHTKPVAKLALVLLTTALTLAIGVTPAHAVAPWWQIDSETGPTSLPPGREGEIVVNFANLGDVPAEGAKSTITTAIKLPAGLTPTRIQGAVLHKIRPQCSLTTLRCSFEGSVQPYEQLSIFLRVKVAEGTPVSLPVEASVEGGGAGRVTASLNIPVGGEPAAYGFEHFGMALLNEDGTPASEAGSHPFQFTTTLTMNQAAEQPVQLPKDFHLHLPPGLIGNPTAVSQCSMVDFFAFVREANLCSAASAVGVATVIANEPNTGLVIKTVPVFNLVPSEGEPARFGFEVLGLVPIVIDTSVRSGGDYGVDASIKDTTQIAGLLSSQVTLWGVPGDPRHDNVRGWECVSEGEYDEQVEKTCPASSKPEETPFLTLPTSCATNLQTEPVVFGLESDSWADPGGFLTAEDIWTGENGDRLGFEGCGQLSFEPTLDATPEEHTASTPTGLDVEVKVPDAGLLDPEGSSPADIRDTTVTLPAGVELSPAAATGLVGCPEGPQNGFEGAGFSGFAKFYADEPGPETTTFTRSFRFVEEEVEGTKLLPSCPEGSKVGTVEIETPLLPNKLTGYVYLAEPAPNGEEGKNPFGSLVALYIVARDPVSGVLVKLAGEGVLDEGSLRVKTVFRNAPQVPFSALKLHLFGGQRASVSTPALCGSYVTDASFTPWSGTGPLPRQSREEDFQITAGVGGGACPGATLPFAPGFDAYSTSTQAGGFTGFQLELARPDGDQALSAVSMHLPSGIAALLASVELCSDAQAAVHACPAGSEVGHATAIAGLGSEPYVQEGGRVFITEGYEGAPFGLEIVTPAQAGPFDLGYVTVRSKLYVNPTDASVTIVSDPLPTQIRGIPLQLKRVLVTVDRPGFEFNPTSCEPMSIGGTISGAEGASAGVSSPFQVGGCEALPFSPQLAASAAGHGSKTEGTTFAVTVRSGGTNATGVAQAGIAKVQLQLPKQLSSRLPTLQKACIDAVFNTNPASCDQESVIGYATIHTPVLKSPLTGPAYLVSHGGAAFPDVEFVLQGEGIKLLLDGKTDIKGEVTYSRFESTPDAPFTVFETVLPAGPHGVLTPNVPESKRFSLCGETLSMPTTMIAQNGKRIEQETRVTVTGCGEVRSAKVSKLTLKQRLKRSLRSCKHTYKHAKHRRVKCEHQAHARYTRQALAACRHQHKHQKKQRKACERAARNRFAAKNARHASNGKGARGQGGS
jgi:hypothetical protein